MLNAPAVSKVETAEAIVRAGAAGIRELFFPLNQGLHVVRMLHGLHALAPALDRVLLVFAL